MTDEIKVNTKPLHDIKRASRYAAKTLLPENAKDGQVNIVAEKIAIQAMGAAIGQGRFTLPDRPMTHTERVAASQGGEPSIGA